MMNKHIVLTASTTAFAFSLSCGANAGPIDYRALIIVENGSGTSLGYVQNDPNYWTPQLTPDSGSAMIVDFHAEWDDWQSDQFSGRKHE